MIKLVLRIKELTDNNLYVEMKQISKKEFLSSTQNEKIAASEIKNAIELLIKKIKEENMKEGK